MTSAAAPVLVGYDGSPDAALALGWASEQAALLARPLSVVIARGDLYTLSRWADEWTRGLAEEWANHARELLAEHGCPQAAVEIADGLPVPVLIERSRGAWALVLGTRGHGRLAGILLGSVTQHVTRHAHCPVVAVRPARDPASREVCVGVDGSTESLRALDFALEVASAERRSVRAVHCWDPPRGAGDERYDELADRLAEELRHQREEVEQAVSRAGRTRPDVPLTVELSPWRPVRALTQASGRAALVVVGSRGRDGFTGLLLGSASAEVQAHAHCPVAVVR